MEWSARSEASYRLPGVPEIRPAGRNWEERVDEWRSVVRTRPIAERPDVSAGNRGELSLRRLLNAHETSRFGELFGGKRVPRVAGDITAGRYEIDLIVVTPRRVVAFEAKHWSGRLRSDGTRWIYERRSGEVQVFDDLADRNAEKLECLRRYLQASGVELPMHRFEQQIVFTHPRIELDRHLSSHPRVVTVAQLPRTLPSLSAATSRGAYLLAALIERCASARASETLVDGLFDILPPSVTAAAAAAISRLRTWDVLRLFGGRQLLGDLLWLQLDGRRLCGADLAAMASARLQWRRNRLVSMLPLFGFGSFGRMIGDLMAPCSLRAHDCVYFHEAGEPRPAVIALTSVDGIQMG